MAGGKVKGGFRESQVHNLLSNWNPGSVQVNFEQKFKTSWTGHERTKNLEAAIDHDQFDEDTTDLFDNFLFEDSAASSEGPYEDGVDSEAANQDPSRLLLVFAATGKQTKTGRRYCRVVPSLLQGGGYGTEPNKSARIETKFKGVVAGEDIPLGPDYWPDNLLTGDLPTYIPKGEMSISFWADAVR